MADQRVGLARLSRCRACHMPVEALQEVLSLDPMPLVGHFASSAEEARGLPHYPFTLVFCTACGLVQALEDVDADLLFGSYRYKSSAIAGVVRHFGAYAADLAALYGRRPVAVLEVGCNDGVFLRQLPRTWRRVGVDPSDVAAQAADGTYELVNAHFTSALSRQMTSEARFDLVVSSNCLAHVSDIGDVLLGMAQALRDDGEVWIEAHDLEAVLAGQWDALYHEHKAYWSIGSLARCAALYGLELVEALKLPFHGGLLRARFRRTGPTRTMSAPRRPSFERVRRAYAERRASAAYGLLEHANRAAAPVAAYGASGRAAVWFNQLPELRFDYIVDDSPLRANTFVAGVGAPVVEPTVFRARPPQICVITAWNYAADIRSRHPWFEGTWLQDFTADEPEQRPAP